MRTRSPLSLNGIGTSCGGSANITCRLFYVLSVSEKGRSVQRQTASHPLTNHYCLRIHLACNDLIVRIMQCKSTTWSCERSRKIGSILYRISSSSSVWIFPSSLAVVILRFGIPFLIPLVITDSRLISGIAQANRRCNLQAFSSKGTACPMFYVPITLDGAEHGPISH